ncbi:MAG: HAMP domain-containing histidine kinase [Bacteroidetes bacterium]|nr:HAMP domain-containing histidine kinase [Bacteroidota bacterium]
MKTTAEVATQELDKAKSIIDQFINSCSHNLKSPLTSIEGLVMIAEYCSDRDEIKQCLELIHHCAVNMQEMIKSLEDYTINLQRELNHEEIFATDLVDKILKEYAQHIEENNIAFSTSISQPFNWISDRQCNYLILKNLVDNAIQFSDPTKENKKVNVTVGVQVDQVNMEVSDNGIGIAEDEIEKVFEPFHRSSSHSKGNGLGLFLVKGIVNKLKASISVKSKEKVGTSFSLSLPNHQLI